MGMDEAADILAETLEEEKETNKELTEIAENNINWEAEQEGEAQEKMILMKKKPAKPAFLRLLLLI